MTVSTPVTNELPKVLQDITAERQRQIEMGYTPEHDDQWHNPPALLSELASGRAHRTASREELVKATAMLCAAIEAIDRQSQRNFREAATTPVKQAEVGEQP